MRWRHVKRGTTYTEVARGPLQKSTLQILVEGDELVAYQSEADGKVCFRSAIEFDDGRFVALPETAKSTDAMRDQLTQTLEKGLTDDCMASIKNQLGRMLEEIEGDIEYRLKDDLAPNLSSYVVEMAKKTIDAILAGNDEEMRRYLGCERGCWTGRSDSLQYGRKREMDEWHPVIRDHLFEQGAIALRHLLVSAHTDLIASQRILDLEDQVRSLTAQVNKATAEKDEMWRRCSEER